MKILNRKKHTYSIHHAALTSAVIALYLKYLFSFWKWLTLEKL